jgi:hypothetical protein
MASLPKNEHRGVGPNEARAIGRVGVRLPYARHGLGFIYSDIRSSDRFRQRSAGADFTLPLKLSSVQHQAGSAPPNRLHLVGAQVAKDVWRAFPNLQLMNDPD